MTSLDEALLELKSSLDVLKEYKRATLALSDAAQSLQETVDHLERVANHEKEPNDVQGAIARAARQL